MELVVVVPFVLVLLAAVWDLRQHISFRTELSREMYTVAEAISDAPSGASPLESAVLAVEERFRTRSDSGRVRVVVAGRGTQRPGGIPCPTPVTWCLPEVLAAYPASAADTVGTWSTGGSNICPSAGDPLPAVGSHFAAGQRMLPQEGMAPPSPEDTWVSRNLAEQEWWVVVEACIEPRPGLFM
ncbi:MAG: hypothetical protein OXG71_02555, partial [Rhodospirillales bacterium]|nr:hypothetical protein [Rhodospirillales bacterium]